MVDDTMEITSDHGYGDDQGDIDIDLDLTAGPGDEDYILEDADAIPNIDFGNNFHAQPSVAVNDDIMIDDDDNSYQMEDAEILDEETQHIIEQESMSFANDGDPLYFGLDGQVGEQTRASDANVQSYEDHEPTNAETLGLDLQEDSQQGIQAILPKVVQQPEATRSKNEEELKEDDSAPGSQTPKSGRHSFPPVAAFEPRSPPTTIAELGATSPHSMHDHTNQASVEDTGDVTTGTAQILSSLQHVVVVYREVEYTLFSSSEHDDPDSYFLSDSSMAEKPLSALFTAIRDVIREDLADEDELCIVVEDLGLQAEETSSVIGDVTLSQLLDLYAELSNNDGHDYIHGCHIILKTRTNFSRRFANLVQAAAEGTGLSAYTFWDDQSVGLDDSEELEESKHEIEPITNGQEADGATEDEEQQQNEHPDSNDNGTDMATQLDVNDSLRPPGTKIDNASHTTLPEGISSEVESKVASSNSIAPKVSEKIQDRGSDIDEDGDIIDYSDEEDVTVKKPKPATKDTGEQEAHTGIHIDFLQPNCALPQTCLCSKCSSLIVEDFEKKDEFLRRRSFDRHLASSGLNPDDDGEAIDEPELGNQEAKIEGEASFLTNDDARGHDFPRAPVSNEENMDQNEIGYEQFPPGEGEDLVANEYEHLTEDHLAYRDDQADDGDLATASVIQGGTENEENGENNTSSEYYGNGEDFDVAHQEHESSAVQDTNLGAAIANFENDDLEFDIEAAPPYDDTNGDDHQPELGEPNGASDAQETSKASSLELVDTAESSVTMGADEIQYEDGPHGPRDKLDKSGELHTYGILENNASPEVASIVKPKDEIDYEDDDDEVEPSARNPAGAHVTQNGNGKRSIADVELNDAQTSHTNDAKRPRS